MDVKSNGMERQCQCVRSETRQFPIPPSESICRPGLELGRWALTGAFARFRGSGDFAPAPGAQRSASRGRARAAGEGRSARGRGRRGRRGVGVRVRGDDLPLGGKGARARAFQPRRPRPVCAPSAPPRSWHPSPRTPHFATLNPRYSNARRRRRCALRARPGAARPGGGQRSKRAKVAHIYPRETIGLTRSVRGRVRHTTPSTRTRPALVWVGVEST